MVKPLSGLGIGTVLSILASVLAAVAAFVMKDHDTLIGVQAAQLERATSELQFRSFVMQKLTDIENRQLERDKVDGVRWRDLPPSGFTPRERR